jgi:hypothetical protein
MYPWYNNNMIMNFFLILKKEDRKANRSWGRWDTIKFAKCTQYKKSGRRGREMGRKLI